MNARPSITCPCCGATSYHPEDIAQRYCGRCYAYTGDPGFLPGHLAGECPNREAPGPFADLAWLLDSGRLVGLGRCGPPEASRLMYFATLRRPDERVRAEENFYGASPAEAIGKAAAWTREGAGRT